MLGWRRGPQPPRWYTPGGLTPAQMSQYDRDNAHYLAAVLDDLTWWMIDSWRQRAVAGEIGGAQDGARGCGGLDPQEV